MGFKKILGNIKEKYDDYSDQRKKDRARQEKIEREGSEKHLKYEKAVNSLLEKFEIPDLDQFLTRIVGEKPEPEYEIEEDTGRERKINPSRRDYLDSIWENLDTDEISFQQLKDFAKKNRIVSQSLFWGRNRN